MQENCKLRWVSSGAILADFLTKSMDSSKLRDCLHSGRYALFDEAMVLKQRSDHRKKLSWVRESEKPPNQEANEQCLQSVDSLQDFWKLDRSKGWVDPEVGKVYPHRVSR